MDLDSEGAARVLWWLAIGFAACCMACIVGCGAEPEDPAPRRPAPASSGEGATSSASTDPLDLAWRFASAIHDDLDDQAACQAQVAIERLRRDGDVDAALRLGHRINRWNRGIVLAAAAEALVRRGDGPRAELVVADTRLVAEKGVEQGWQADRIREALARVKVLQDAPAGSDAASADLEVQWGLAQAGAGIFRLSLEMDAVEAALDRGPVGGVSNKVEAIEVEMRGFQAPVHVLLPLHARCARLLARAGLAAPARELAKATADAAATLLPIDRPGVLATAAAALSSAGDKSAAAALHLEAIRQALALENPRPRLMALCRIAMSLDGGETDEGGVRAALEQAARELLGE